MTISGQTGLISSSEQREIIQAQAKPNTTCVSEIYVQTSAPMPLGAANNAVPNATMSRPARAPAANEGNRRIASIGLQPPANATRITQASSASTGKANSLVAEAAGSLGPRSFHVTSAKRTGAHGTSNNAQLTMRVRA